MKSNDPLPDPPLDCLRAELARYNNLLRLITEPKVTQAIQNLIRDTEARIDALNSERGA